MESLTATLTNRPDGDGVESLSLNAAASTAATGAGLTVLYTPGTGVLSITGSATTATYQTILQGIRYSNTSENPNTANRIVDVVVNDGTDPSVLNTVTIGHAVNDAPVTDLNGDVVTFTEGNAFVLVDATPLAASIADIDSADLDGGSLMNLFSGCSHQRQRRAVHPRGQRHDGRRHDRQLQRRRDRARLWAASASPR